MKVTDRESAAARCLAEALIEFLVAHDEGRILRRANRPRQEIAVRLEQPPAPSTPASPSRGSSSQDEPRTHLLNAKEAAKYLSVGARKLWSMTMPRGPLPVVRFGKAMRYSVADLDAAIQRNRVKPRKDYPL